MSAASRACHASGISRTTRPTDKTGKEDNLFPTMHRAARRYSPADDTSPGAYRWSSHLANVSEAAPRRRLRFRFGHFRRPYGHERRHIYFQPAWGFLLGFYTSHSPKCTVFEHGTVRETDRRTDGQIAPLLNASISYRVGHNKLVEQARRPRVGGINIGNFLFSATQSAVHCTMLESYKFIKLVKWTTVIP